MKYKNNRLFCKTEHMSKYRSNKYNLLFVNAQQNRLSLVDINKNQLFIFCYVIQSSFYHNNTEKLHCGTSNVRC